MNRYLCITCEVLARPVYWCAATSPHLLDVELLKRGLHNQPLNLRTRLQERIDDADNQGYNSIILVYGLCGQATAGLVARSIPLIIPRAHDCITLFLGSRARYQDQFENYPGTFWYSQDYIERDDGSGTTLSMGSGSDTDLQSVYGEYVEKYGKENADYLMEVMGAWQQHYKRAAFIDLGIGNGSNVEKKARDEAARRGWSFEKLIGDLNLVRDLLEGNWQGTEIHPAQTQENNRFLIVPPGQKVIMTYDDRIIACEKGSA
jgi:hypothetical protein